MGTKHLKFVSITEAITEITNTLLMQSELKKREELEPLLRQLEDLQIRKGTKKVHPLDFVSRDGLWIKYQGSEKFYYGTEKIHLPDSWDKARTLPKFPKIQKTRIR